jgi:RHS repeat-associated protein
MDYDAAGRAVRQQKTLDGVSYVAQRRYDSAGRLRGITYPDNEAIGTEGNPITYDRAGRLYAIPGILNAVVYDGAGRPTSQTAADAPPNTVTTRTYSTRGLLTDIVTTHSNTTIQNLHYQLDQAGLVDWVTSPSANEGWDYTYDELHRLTNAQSFWDVSQNQSFQYDSIGRMINNSRVGPYSYLPNGWGHSHAPETVNGNVYGYDLNGNLYSGGDRTIQWSPDNLVSQVTTNSVTTSFTYDGLGERVKKTSTNPTSTSIYPIGDDYEVTNGAITKYVTVAGLGVIAKKVGTDTFWIHTDRLGSLQAISNYSGAIVQRRSYRPYGDKIADMPSHVEARGFIDQRQDSETGLTYLHARFYDPVRGLFLSPDPIGPTGGLNEYGYSLGDPINVSDRSGLSGDGDGTNGVNCTYVGTSSTGHGSIGGIDISNQPTNVFICTSMSSRGSNPFAFFTSPFSSMLADFRESMREWRRSQRQQQLPQEEAGNVGCQSDECPGNGGGGGDDGGGGGNGDGNAGDIETGHTTVGGVEVRFERNKITGKVLGVGGPLNGGDLALIYRPLGGDVTIPGNTWGAFARRPDGGLTFTASNRLSLDGPLIFNPTVSFLSLSPSGELEGSDARSNFPFSITPAALLWDAAARAGLRRSWGSQAGLVGGVNAYMDYLERASGGN